MSDKSKKGAKIKGYPNYTTDKFYRKDGEKIWWVDTSDQLGLFLFSFDKKKVYNMFQDYPYKLSDEEKELFDRENPFWAKFFRGRTR